MGDYVRIDMRRGSSRPWTGRVVNRRTGGPINLREADTSIVFTARIREEDDPIITKTYGLEDDIEGIEVDPDAPDGDVYTITWARADTIDITEQLLLISVIVVEPGDEGDEHVYGVLALSG